MTKKTLTARTPEDLLAMVPCTFGFHPEESIVMMAFGRQPFQGRIDIPSAPADVDGVVDCLVGPASANGAEAVVLIAYGDDSALLSETLLALWCGFETGGILIIEMLRVHDGRWFGVRPGFAATSPDGVAFTLDDHPFIAQSVYDGQVTHANREALADTLIGTDPELVDRVEESAFRAATRWRDVQVAAEAQWVRDTVLRHVHERTVPGEDELGRLLIGLQDSTLCNVALGHLSREESPAHLEFWRDIVRCTPQAFLAPPATLLAFASWLAGQGALAWCAVDRAVLVEPDYALAQKMAGILTSAVPPTAWESSGQSALLA